MSESMPIAAALEAKIPGPLVYRLFAADGALLYVGCTKVTLASRLRGHRSSKDWWSEVAAVSVEPFETHAAALAAEKAAIQGERPGRSREVPAETFEAAVERLLAGVPPLTDPAICARVAELLRPYVRERRRAA